MRRVLSRPGSPAPADEPSRTIDESALVIDEPAPVAAPTLSVVVVMHRMTEQIANTLLSLTPPYQEAMRLEEYEIILVDNGSPEPLPQEAWGVAENIRYHYIPPEDADPNPGVAINRAVEGARAPFLCVMIDGARMASPRMLRWGLELTRLSASAVADARGWHLGPKLQNQSIEEGYDREAERRLLESVGWRENGYRLFEISAPSAATRFGFYGGATESACLFMRRELFDALGGYDERYRYPGGGLVNRDFFFRAVSEADHAFTLLGEGHFHQLHGGAATGLSMSELKKAALGWREEYTRLSRPFDLNPPPYVPILSGHVPTECRRWMA